MRKATQNDSSNETDVKAPETPELDAHTKRLVEKSIVRVNGLLSEAGGKYDDIADHLFETYYDGDVQRALTPTKDAPAGIAALAREAEGALSMSRTSLFQAVRIGALNRRLTRTVWKTLGWSLKMELLPLLGTGLAFDRLSAGAVHASKTQASVRDIREYVAKQLEPATDGAPVAEQRTGPSFPAGLKALSVTAAMTRFADRRKWVDRYLALDKDDQGAFLNSVKTSARNLEKLAQELAAAVDDG